MSARVHGGPDGRGPVPHDFSANGHACGPCPVAAQRIASVDAASYPDPAYTHLRQALAGRHGVSPDRVVLAASGSEFIFRLTALRAKASARTVRVPRHAYGDYAQAAQAWGLQVTYEGRAELAWSCEPSSPLGRADAAIAEGGGLQVIDRAYEPLRLGGERTPTPAQAWELWSPNKALGLTGVRAAYAIAPEGAEPLVRELDALAPSWPIGAHGVAMLQAWCDPSVQRWLDEGRPKLRAWKERQVAQCGRLGWTVEASDTSFFVVRAGLDAAARDALLARGVRVRDCTSFGLPGHLRLAVRPPASQDALVAAVEALR